MFIFLRFVLFNLQNVTKATMIEYCCPGFVEVKDTPPPSNETIVPEVSAHLNRTGNMICRPLCRGGCGKGICQAPNSCKCDVGYEGRHCSQSKSNLMQIYM